tara:strand:- start:9576 stop:10388 length:813 start_codon:yes stop_codon:yes gene_type:complete
MVVADFVEFFNEKTNMMEKFPVYGSEYITSSGAKFDNPFSSHPYMGEVFYDIVSNNENIQNSMIELLRLEGPLLHGAEQIEDIPGFLPLMYDRWFGEDLRTDDELREIALNSIEGLKDLEYVIGNPMLERSSMSAGFVLGEYLPGNPDETWAPRSFEETPDSVIVSSPTKWQYTLDGADMHEREYTEEDNLKTLIHEGLLHGMGIYHPNAPIYYMLSGMLPESAGLGYNYDVITGQIYDELTEVEKERLLYHLYPDEMRQTKHYSNMPVY